MEWRRNTTRRNDTAVPLVITRETDTRIIMPSRGSTPPAKVKKKPGNPHKADGTTFGVVYANDLAKAEIAKKNPIFPVGSIIVREKHLSIKSEMPEIVIAMVKREKGFSKKTGDWEFFTLDSKAEIATRRETKGNCASCHTMAKETDWVFRDYLK